MAFGEDSWEDTLPHYLISTEKARLKFQLYQFFGVEHRLKDKDYQDFYLDNPPVFFMQGDILESMPICSWDSGNDRYDTGFAPVMLLSNSCDVSNDNVNLLEKEALFTQLIPLDEYFSDLKANGFTIANIESIYNGLTHQAYSNLFYLPPTPNDKREFIVFFDKIFWHPSCELIKKLEFISEQRFLSLSHFGFYLLITKLSYHFCRVPETRERFA
jgi:hypothetical protein